MNILDVNAADLGGAIAHLAASQLYQVLTEDEEGEAGPRTWFGSDPDDDAGIEEDVLDMARYVNGRDIPAEQLWRWAAMNGIVINEGEDYRAVPLPRRLAFEIFTETCARAHHRLELAQLDARKLIPLGAATPAPGLKLEDSIFEPHGSLADQEAFQKQWLKDQEAADRRRLEEAIAALAAAEGEAARSAGAPIDEEEEHKPAGLSAGQKEETDEKEATGEGQAAGDPPAADPGAQGSLGALDRAAGTGEAGDAGEASGDDDAASGGGAVAAPVALPAGGENAADPDRPAEPVKGKKARKGKSTA